MQPIRRKINPHAARLRREMTDAERLVWQRLRNRQLEGFKFRRQATIGPYVVDFCVSRQGLIVEIGGGQHSTERDAKRSTFLEQGYRIARFWNHEVADNLEGVLSAIGQALKQ